jgi:2-(1,2-epoxy-1,2-dihydrophenyl)acetyl-CoA isomerase
MKNQLIRLCVADGIATASFNDPHRLNPLSPALQAELPGLVDRVREDTSIRALILTGEGRAFCTGADLAAIDRDVSNADDPFGTAGDRIAEAMTRVTIPFILALRRLPVPVISAVNGPAAGAGVGIALAADIVVAARSAYFYLPFLTRLGLVPDLGTTWFVERSLGRARAMQIWMLNDRITAEQAASWGLVAECVDDAELVERSLAIARRLALLPAHAALEARRASEAAAFNTLEAQLAYERERQRELIDRPEFVEGMRSFIEKRAAVFLARSQATPLRPQSNTQT